MNTALRICQAWRFAPRGPAEILNAMFICRRKEGRMFFSEEKNQKTFSNSSVVPPQRSAKPGKSLASFLQKRRPSFTSFTS
jgi:hypothetical protein